MQTTEIRRKHSETPKHELILLDFFVIINSTKQKKIKVNKMTIFNYIKRYS